MGNCGRKDLLETGWTKGVIRRFLSPRSVETRGFASAQLAFVYGELTGKTSRRLRPRSAPRISRDKLGM